MRKSFLLIILAAALGFLAYRGWLWYQTEYAFPRGEVVQSPDPLDVFPLEGTFVRLEGNFLYFYTTTQTTANGRTYENYNQELAIVNGTDVYKISASDRAGEATMLPTSLASLKPGDKMILNLSSDPYTRDFYAQSIYVLP